jgi:hypothetical protein
MHSKEFKVMAEVADEMSCVVLAFAPLITGNNYVVLFYNEDAERYNVYSLKRMQFRDGTFMQWDWERELGVTEDRHIALMLFAKNI